VPKLAGYANPTGIALEAVGTTRGLESSEVCVGEGSEKAVVILRMFGDAGDLLVKNANQRHTDKGTRTKAKEAAIPPE